MDEGSKPDKMANFAKFAYKRENFPNRTSYIGKRIF